MSNKHQIFISSWCFISSLFSHHSLICAFNHNWTPKPLPLFNPFSLFALTLSLHILYHSTILSGHAIWPLQIGSYQLFLMNRLSIITKNVWWSIWKTCDISIINPHSLPTVCPSSPPRALCTTIYSFLNIRFHSISPTKQSTHCIPCQVHTEMSIQVSYTIINCNGCEEDDAILWLWRFC